MEPQKHSDNFGLDDLDLEIFSSELPQKPIKKISGFSVFLTKTYVKVFFTSSLLLFLFVSTFFIASKTQQPSLRTSSASVGYVPQARIEIPKSTGVESCSDLTYKGGELTFLQSYCQGDFCTAQTSQEACEAVDSVVFEGDALKEESGQDGISDCDWVEDEASCKPKY